MARFYPTDIDSFHGSEGEKAVYKSLQKLNDDYTIFYSYRWLGDVSRWRTEGEVDFLVLHPRKGILSIEVKAGGIAYEDGRWIQINRNTGHRKKIDPLGQAAESQFTIRQQLKNRYPYEIPIIGRAAWFTSVIVGKQVPLPLEVNQDIILDFEALADPETALDRAFLFWQQNLGRTKNLEQSADEFKELVKCLMPTFHIAEAIGSNAHDEALQYIQLTQQQAGVLHYLQEQRTAAIHGPAGTGKTLLAIEKAKLLAAEGQKVLYLCFNELLLAYVKEHYAHPLITFHNIRTLAEEIMQDKTLPISEVIPRFETYFNKEYDDDTWEFPNIIIDEGQDFNDILLEHLDYLAELNNGAFYIFYDRNQYILRNEAPEWINQTAECRLVLYKNCRNTSEIASTISSIMPIKKDVYVNAVHGETPRACFFRGETELVKIAGQFIKKMLSEGLKAEEIAILSVHSMANSMLKNYIESGNRLGDCDISQERVKDKVLVSTVRKFKGLEAKAVLLIDVESSKLADSVMRRLMYVGCSRANSYLQIAFYDDSQQSKAERKATMEMFGLCKV